MRHVLCTCLPVFKFLPGSLITGSRNNLYVYFPPVSLTGDFQAFNLRQIMDQKGDNMYVCNSKMFGEIQLNVSHLMPQTFVEHLLFVGTMLSHKRRGDMKINKARSLCQGAYSLVQ